MVGFEESSFPWRKWRDGKEKDRIRDWNKPETIRTGLSGARGAFAWWSVNGKLSASGGPEECSWLWGQGETGCSWSQNVAMWPTLARLLNPPWSRQPQKAWLTPDDMKLHWVTAWSYEPRRLWRPGSVQTRDSVGTAPSWLTERFLPCCTVPPRPHFPTSATIPARTFLYLAFLPLPVPELRVCFLTTFGMDFVIISQLCPGPDLLSRLLATLLDIGSWGFRPPALNSSEGFSFPWVISSCWSNESLETTLASCQRCFWLHKS